MVCGWHSLYPLMIKLSILHGKSPPVPVNSWAVLYEQPTWDVPRVAQWYWGQETDRATQEPSFYSAVANDMLTWLYVLDHYVGISKYVPCGASGLMITNFFREYFLMTYCIHLAINFDQVSCLFGWHWHSNGFLLAARLCSKFFFKCFLTVHLETSICRFFFASPTFSRPLWQRLFLVDLNVV